LLSNESIVYVTDQMESWYGVYMTEALRSEERRRLERRRQGRFILSDIDFLYQTVERNATGFPTNYFVYEHRVVYELPVGGVPILFDNTFAAPEPTDQDPLVEEDEKTFSYDTGEIEKIPDLGDLTPREVAVRPFEDFRVNIALGNELKENVPELEDTPLPLPVPTTITVRDNIPEEEPVVAILASGRRLTPMQVSFILMASGTLATISAFVYKAKFVKKVYRTY